MIQAHIIVGGVVQGVGFRMFVQRSAILLGIDGTVKNLPNGDVEVHAQGTKSQIGELVRIMKEGNGHSRVDLCEIEWNDTARPYSSFQIVY